MANDFSADPSCKALWRFENGALTVDSKGINTLTAVNAPTADLVNFKEGAAATNLIAASHQFYKITDANLAAGFPLKNGDAVRKISVCFWARPTSFGGWRGMIGKTTYLNSSSDCGVEINGSGVVYVKYAGLEISTGITLAINTFYHIGFTVDGLNKHLFLRVTNDSNGSVQDWSYEATATLSVGTLEWRIGEYSDQSTNYSFDGKIDEVVVFDRILYPGEITAIRNGVFPTVVNNSVTTAGVQVLPLYSNTPSVIASMAQAVVLWNDVSPNGHLYVANGIGQAVYENQANLRLSETHALVLWSDRLPSRRKFPLPNPRLRYQSQFGCRKFPVAP